MAPATNLPIDVDPVLYNGLRHEFDRIKFNINYNVETGTQGIIYVGGGKYWPGIMVGVRLLRKLGCMLPIEIWYREGVEEVYPEDIQDIYVTLHPITKKMGGWESKLHALYNTLLHKIMFLDADAYCVENPCPLFELLGEETPFIYWKDLPSQANSIKWKGVYPEGAEIGIPQVQGGQLLIDRLHAGKLIHACKYMCDNSDYYFKRMYGDQDTWRVALAGGCAKYLCVDNAIWDRIAFKCLWKNTLYIVHRCKGKLFTAEHIPHGNRQYANPHYDYPLEAEVFSLFGEYVNRRKGNHVDAFNAVYKSGIWGTASGTGSTLKEGQPYIDFVNDLIGSKGYKSVIDVGCGDGLIGSKIRTRNYIGYECSDVVIAKKAKKNFSFNPYIHLDISTNYDRMNSADILLCKDVLHHWPNETVKRFVDYLIKVDKWKAIVLCFDRKQLYDNQECHIGGYRALDVAMEPLKQFGLTFAKTFFHKGIVLILKV